MAIGRGAKNKNFSFLFDKSIALVRHALQGCLDGDGHYRKRYNKSVPYFECNLKSCSKRLIYDFISLCKIKFGADVSYEQGMNPSRQIEGRELAPSAYYRATIYGKANLDKVLGDNIQCHCNPFLMDMDYDAIGSHKYSRKHASSGIVITSIEEVGTQDVVDVTLDDTSNHVFMTKFGVLSHNCGGGEPTSHPDFLEILRLCKDLGIVPNFTTRNINWFRNEKNVEVFKECCGSVAFSIDHSYGTLHEIMPIVEYWDLENYASIQCIDTIGIGKVLRNWRKN